MSTSRLSSEQRALESHVVALAQQIRLGKHTPQFLFLTDAPTRHWRKRFRQTHPSQAESAYMSPMPSPLQLSSRTSAAISVQAGQPIALSLSSLDDDAAASPLPDASQSTQQQRTFSRSGKLSREATVAAQRAMRGSRGGSGETVMEDQGAEPELDSDGSDGSGSDGEVTSANRGSQLVSDDVCATIADVAHSLLASSDAIDLDMSCVEDDGQAVDPRIARRISLVSLSDEGALMRRVASSASESLREEAQSPTQQSTASSKADDDMDEGAGDDHDDGNVGNGAQAIGLGDAAESSAAHGGGGGCGGGGDVMDEGGDEGGDDASDDSMSSSVSMVDPYELV